MTLLRVPAAPSSPSWFEVMQLSAWHNRGMPAGIPVNAAPTVHGAPFASWCSVCVRASVCVWVVDVTRDGSWPRQDEQAQRML